MNPLARLKISGLSRRLREARTELTKSGKPLHPSEESEEVRQLLKFYDRTLDALLEYERTGFTHRLFFPHPVMSTTSFAFKVASLPFKAIGALFPKKKLPSKVSQCFDTLAGLLSNRT
jgi:hypothetical protein